MLNYMFLVFIIVFIVLRTFIACFQFQGKVMSKSKIR